MAAKRDAVKQVLEIKQRNRPGHRSQIYFDRVGTLKRAFRTGAFADELLRYFPIGIIATVESFFRSVYAELIDSGEPYALRVNTLAKDLKIDWAGIRAIEGKTISSGEAIAISLSLNNLGDIQRVMDTLLETDFLNALKDLQKDSGRDKGAPLLSEPKETFRHVARSFELRHIFCHESASGIQTSKDEIEDCLDYCALFLDATEALLWRRHPHYGLTQHDLTQKAEKTYGEVREQVAGMLKTLNGFLEHEARQSLVDSQKKWEVFSESNADFMAFLYRGGSMHPMVKYNALADDAKVRVKQLEGFVSEWKSLTELL